MKRCKTLLICLLAMSIASANGHERFAAIKANVVHEVRASSAFVEEQAAKAGTPRRWLMLLAACGLVTMQLRRKHKSLPQRRIAPYG